MADGQGLPRRAEQHLLVGDQPAQPHRVDAYARRRRRRAHPPATSVVASGIGRAGRPRGGRRRRARPYVGRCREGASALSGWCSSMISTDSKYGAAWAANRIISTAPIAKFGATSTPTAGAAPQPATRSVPAGPRRSRWCRRRVDAVLDAELEVGHHRVGRGEVDRHLGARLDERAEVVAPAHGGRPARGRRRPRPPCTAVDPMRPAAPSTATRMAHATRPAEVAVLVEGADDARGSARGRAGRRRPRCTSSSVHRVDPVEDVADGQQLAVAAARPCRSGSSASRCPRARAPARRASAPCPRSSSSDVMPPAATSSTSLAADRQHVVDLLGQAAGVHAEHARCRRTATRRSRPSRPGRASRGPPGTAG